MKTCFQNRNFGEKGCLMFPFAMSSTPCCTSSSPDVVGVTYRGEHNGPPEAVLIDGSGVGTAMEPWQSLSGESSTWLKKGDSFNGTMELWTAPFPPGKGGGEGVAYGGKGKGILIHLVTEGNGMPLSCCSTPANGDKRQQVLPLLDQIKVRAGGPGRPRKRIKVLAGDKGYDAKWRAGALRQRGIRGQIAKRRYKGNKPRGRPIQMSVPRFQQERCFA